MINHKYAVETKVFNNGKIEISKPFEVDFSTESKQESTEKYDFYLDVFPSKKEALSFIEENKEY